jgi:hypothetical protein
MRRRAMSVQLQSHLCEIITIHSVVATPLRLSGSLTALRANDRQSGDWARMDFPSADYPTGTRKEKEKLG